MNVAFETDKGTNWRGNERRRRRHGQVNEAEKIIRRDFQRFSLVSFSTVPLRINRADVTEKRGDETIETMLVSHRTKKTWLIFPRDSTKNTYSRTIKRNHLFRKIKLIITMQTVRCISHGNFSNCLPFYWHILIVIHWFISCNLIRNFLVRIRRIFHNLPWVTKYGTILIEYLIEIISIFRRCM